MATWSYFTAYLDGTRPIRAEERDELWTNFETILHSCAATHTLDATIIAAIKASGLITDLTPLKISGAAAGTVDLPKTIGSVTSSVFAPTGLTRLTAAATAEGLSSPEYDALFSASTRERATTVDDYRIWNVLKRCIDALSCCALPTFTNTAFNATETFPFSCSQSSSGATSFSATGVPTGLSFNTTTGAITGTPVGVGTYVVNVTATNSCGSVSGTCTITVYAAASAPSASFRARSASLTKCGFDEWVASTPPKVYLRADYTGSITTSSYANTDCTGALINRSLYEIGGYCEYTRPACTVDQSGTQRTRIDSDGDGSYDSDTGTVSGYCHPSPGGDTSISNSATVRTFTGIGCNGFGANSTGTATLTLSNEYTDFQLGTDVSAALAVAGWIGWGGTVQVGLQDLDVDHVTLTYQEAEYKFDLSAASGHASYRIRWDVMQLPSGGSPSVVTTLDYYWDGSATETGAYSLSVPGSNAQLYIANVRATFY